jgi:23S rRNA G2445 N2-methylase RlmL
MVAIFALTTRGLEDVSAQEMATLPGLRIREIAYRRITADYTGALDALLKLRTVDDLFLHLAEWPEIERQRAVLTRIEQLSTELALEQTAHLRSRLQPLDGAPAFSVSASFVGKRNYTTAEIKQAVAAGVQRRTGWTYREQDEPDALHLRLFIEREQAVVGLRLAATPLHRRAFKQMHLPGSLKPPVAAALLRLAGAPPATAVLDPCCGAGTILVEAAQLGLHAQGGDSDPAAVAAAQANAQAAGVALDVRVWDVRRLPLHSGSATRIVTNLPWGRQVETDETLAQFYRETCRELHRILAAQGRIVLLSNTPQLVAFPGLTLVAQREISLFGQTPAVMLFAKQH